MQPRSPFPERDVFGNRLQPGDRIIHDALGRPIRVHPSRICGGCGEIREGDFICQCCGTVCWREPISSALTAGVFVGGAFAARAWLGSPWGSIAFWVAVVIGGYCALVSMFAWYQALRGVGVELFRLVGAALLCGGIGWIIDWWTASGIGTWAVVGAVAGASIELIAEQIYFWNDPRR